MKIKASSIASIAFQSPLGPMTLAATESGLAGVWFDGQQHAPDRHGWQPDAEHPVLVEASAQLADWFAGRRQNFDLPLDLAHGTAFQQAVWSALLGIGYGHTTSYGAIAATIGRPSAVRAVGAAVGRNPLSLVVPCHRIVGQGGALTGYAGGLPRKTALLALERTGALPNDLDMEKAGGRDDNARPAGSGTPEAGVEPVRGARQPFDKLRANGFG